MQEKKPVSIGIITYNDNLHELLYSLSKQKSAKSFISEIIIVSVENSRPYLNGVIRNFELPIKLIFEKERKGKYSAVNKFLKTAKNDILVLCSGDIIIEDDCLDKITEPLIYDEKIGVVASHPCPINSGKLNLLEKINSQLWKLHDGIAKIKPKFGEFIAFRNLHFQIKRTGADEEMIAMHIFSKGYLLRYAEDCRILNTCPRAIRDYISQRKRIFCSHLQLYHKYNYKVPTLFSPELFLVLFKTRNNLLILLLTIFIEIFSRILGFLDFILKKDYAIWEIAKKEKTIRV